MYVAMAVFGPTGRINHDAAVSRGGTMYTAARCMYRDAACHAQKL